MKLSLDNLDDILKTLTIAKDKSASFAEMFDPNQDIENTETNRAVIDMMIERMSAYLMEVSHIDSFLQYTDLEQTPKTDAQHQKIILCQQLCNELKTSSRDLLGWAIALKTKFAIPENPQAITTNDYLVEEYKHHTPTTITPELLTEYDHIREAIKSIHQDVIFIDPQYILDTAGRRLEVKQGSSLMIETEREMNIFVDYGIFQCRKDGLTAAESYYNRNFNTERDNTRKSIIHAYKNSKFALLKILKHIPDHGLIVHDAALQQDFLLLDRGLAKSAQKNTDAMILTHYLTFKNFIITTGAATPIELDKPYAGRILDKYQQILAYDIGSKSYYQGITDLYKIIIHDDITKAVTSRTLPMNYNSLQASH